MSESIISAIERTEKPNKSRKEGFVPGVIYGKDTDPKSVKLEQKEFIRLLHGHAKNSKISVKVGNEVKQCILKEIQRDPVNGKILHVELQAIHGDDIIRLKTPIVFHEREKLAGRQLLLQEYMSEVEIMGKAAIMPEFVSINVGDRKSGDKITVKDIQVGADIKVLVDENEILALITAVKENKENKEDKEDKEDSEESE
jgi:large subunit ribosomal protein L25